MREKTSHTFVISILDCVCRELQNSPHVDGQKTSPDTSMGCEKLACRNDRDCHISNLRPSRNAVRCQTPRDELPPGQGVETLALATQYPDEYPVWVKSAVPPD